MAEDAFFVTLAAADRPGIVAELAAGVDRLEGVIDGLSQTVMTHVFTVLVQARFPAGTTPEAIREALAAGVPEAAIGVLPAPAAAWQAPRGARFILTTRGPDRPGLVTELSRFLAGRDINIEDMYARGTAGESVMVVQLHCPDARDIRQLQLDLAELAEDLGLNAHLQHENVFLATSEIGTVRSLTI